VVNLSACPLLIVIVPYFGSTDSTICKSHRIVNKIRDRGVAHDEQDVIFDDGG